MIHRLSYILLLLMACQLSHAQVKARVELPWKDDVHNYLVVPMKEKGVLLVTLSDKSSGGKRTLRLSHYDTDLRLVASDSAQMDKSLDFDDELYEDGRCLVVLREMGRVLLGGRKVVGDNVGIVTYAPSTHKMEVKMGEFPENATIGTLSAKGDLMAFPSTKRYFDHVGMMDLATGKGQVLDLNIKSGRRKE